MGKNKSGTETVQAKKNKTGEIDMELRPYYDRPTAILADYLARIDTKIKANYPHWGYENSGVWPKGEYG